MKEELLHYAWRTRRFDSRELIGTLGESIEIIHPGTWNRDAGPDFLNATIRISGVLWVGQVEMHLSASDWYRHGHQLDPRYDNVVLHVVWDNDTNVSRNDGSFIPCLVMKYRVSKSLQANYQQLQLSDAWVPCQQWLPIIPQSRKKIWLESLLIQRLEQRISQWHFRMNETQQDAETVFYHMMASAFGLKHNQAPMLALAERLPWSIVRKHVHDLEMLEALFFGMAGLLPEDTVDPYIQALKRSFAYLRHLHALTPMSSDIWIFGGIRPSAFPTVRIAQWCAWLHATPRLWSAFSDCSDWKEMLHAWDVPVSKFWQTHYTFTTEAPKAQRAPGNDTRQLLLINAVLPFLFLYGNYSAQDDLRDKAIYLFSCIPAEENRVIRSWKSLDMPVENAGNTQALLQLKSRYCDAKACLQCAFGADILKETESNL
jgi:hypothetical protein